MTPPRIKICCISSVDEAQLAVMQGASAIGLVSHMPSGPGVIPEPLLAEIAARVPPPVATFLLTALRDADAIAQQHARCGTTALQLVDMVAPQELRRLRRLLPHVRLVQVVHVRGEPCIDEALAVAGLVDALLLDSGNPTLPVKELGGTGRVHDWKLSRRIRDRAGKPVFLAGGLNATNVAAAIEAVRPFGLDLCSGVRQGGALDADRLSAFMRSAGALR
ncbi:MAG TPA: phosphoribosylanthranilate isomerase [Rubrivivax sp.]|jgi:phosphoribosylanthranilate isomerase|nr:phosphoribosylanthranilate isomerase [Rubrivivax sp.]